MAVGRARAAESNGLVVFFLAGIPCTIRRAFQRGPGAFHVPRLDDDVQAAKFLHRRRISTHARDTGAAPTWSTSTTGAIAFHAPTDAKRLGGPAKRALGALFYFFSLLPLVLFSFPLRGNAI